MAILATKVSSTAVTPATQRKPTILRKVIQYLQRQATNQSTAVTHLTPPGSEPHQRRTSQRPAASARFSHSFSGVESARGSGRVPKRDSECNGRPHATMATTLSSPLLQSVKRVQYANDNLLQSYEVFIPETKSAEHGSRESSTEEKLWVFYIHGGYFRDPKVDAAAFRPTVELLTGHSSVSRANGDTHSSRSLDQKGRPEAEDRICGYASINYRLSPHTGYPQDSSTPRYELRNASWPEQVDDILAAIKHLHAKHQIGGRYILSGHSVGATLAFMAALNAEAAGITPPRLVVGANGIYDFPDIHRTNPAYESLTRNAMRPDDYERASPALYAPDRYCHLVTQGVTGFLFSQSKDDGLVPWEQVTRMQSVLEKAKAGSNHLRYEILETQGKHDDIWREGHELARTIERAVEMASTGALGQGVEL